MPRRCAFLTLAKRGSYIIDDEHAYVPLAALGWQVDATPWDDSETDWSQYELVIIRSPWDYPKRPEQFLSVLKEIEASDTRLENPRSIVEWNIRKTYLQDLDERGVLIVPSVFAERLRPGEINDYFERLQADEIVIKPQIGATASGAYRLRRASYAEQRSEIEEYYADTALLAQPYMPCIASEGEYSLFYFNGEFSHAILKTPKAQDFRSQEEHGAKIGSVEIDEALRASGQRAIEAVGQTLLYARVDFVRGGDAKDYHLMELELIEPSLYLRTHPEAPQRFAEAVHSIA